MAFLEDFWNPNTWANEKYEYRVYADDYANVYAIVDQVDYQYLIQWRWKVKNSNTHGKAFKEPKQYLARTAHEGARNSRICSTIFLHTVVMDRKGTAKPNTNKKMIIDHANSDGFDCRRDNLRWATIGFNNMNKFGAYEKVMFEEFA